jgi:hypothetical protein
MIDDGEKSEIKMTLEEGTVTDIVDKGPAPAPQ